MKKISVILILVFLLSLAQPLAFAQPYEAEDFVQIELVPGDADNGVFVGDVEPEANVETGESSETSGISEPAVAMYPYETSDTIEDYESNEAYDFDEVIEIDLSAREALRQIVSDRDILALVFLSYEYIVRDTPSVSGTQVIAVPSGHQVQILDVEMGECGTLWVRVSLHYNGTLYEGFVERANLATADSRFLDWESEYGIAGLAMPAPSGRFAPFSAIAPAALCPQIAQFPASYHPQLIALRAAHPNWTFVMQPTGIDWNWMVAQQMRPGWALVHNSFPGFMWTGPAVEPGWHQATEVALKHFLDPRNWLSTPYIFMFEHLIFNEGVHSPQSTQAAIANTFMRGNVGHFNFSAANPHGVARAGAVSGLTYAQSFYNAGRAHGVSPFHLATRVRQEQGVNGTSGLISGRHPGFYDLFNYFNIGAFGPNSATIIRRGLERARDQGWSTRDASIRGGAHFLISSYIRNPNGHQDTIYLQKFNASGGNVSHQYMTNIMAPRSEARTTFNAYRDNNLLGAPFVFRIPVYTNMPAAPSFLPTTTFDIALVAPAGYTANNTRLFLDGVEFNPTFNNGQFVVNPGVGTKRTATMHVHDANNIPIGMFAWALSFSNGAYRVTPLPGVEGLITYHGFSIRILGNSGIRFHSGISIDARNALLSTGINGFTLREYGTVVMNNANSGRHPLILGGTGTASGMSFGQNIDTLFAIQDGRGIFTSVLVNIHPSQYRTEFLFRGYVILRRNGVDYIFYGPPVSRSIYTVANQVLRSGQFPAGSEGDRFIRQIIADAG